MFDIPLYQSVQTSMNTSGNLFDIGGADYYPLKILKVYNGSENEIYFHYDFTTYEKPDFLFIKAQGSAFLNVDDFCGLWGNEICQGFSINFTDGSAYISLVFIKGKILNYIKAFLDFGKKVFSLGLDLDNFVLEASFAYKTRGFNFGIKDFDSESYYKKYCV